VQQVEFKQYFHSVQGKDTSKVLDGDSPDAISIVRNHCAISMARIGQELALMKNQIDTQYLLLRAKDDSTNKPLFTAGDAQKLAEEKVNGLYEVTRRELEYLKDAMSQISNSCASRIKVLENEKIQTMNVDA